VPATAVPPASPAQVPAVPGLTGRTGRTVGAIRASVDDLALVLSPAFLQQAGGGLRGGTWRLRGRRVVLRRFEVVPGVRLTGGGDRRDGLRLRVSGRRAAPGVVRLSAGGRLTGRLGGRRVSVRLRRPPAAPGVRIARVGRAGL
jgi:hypothetical protein